jgi:hypothetical protein
MSATNPGRDIGFLGVSTCGKLFERGPWLYLSQFVKWTRHALGREIMRQRLMDLLQSEQLADYCGPSRAEIVEIHRLLDVLSGDTDEGQAAGSTAASPGAGGPGRREEGNGQAFSENASRELARPPRELV